MTERSLPMQEDPGSNPVTPATFIEHLPYLPLTASGKDKK